MKIISYLNFMNCHEYDNNSLCSWNPRFRAFVTNCMENLKKPNVCQCTKKKGTSLLHAVVSYKDITQPIITSIFYKNFHRINQLIASLRSFHIQPSALTWYHLPIRHVLSYCLNKHYTSFSTKLANPNLSTEHFVSKTSIPPCAFFCWSVSHNHFIRMIDTDSIYLSHCA